MLHLGYKNWLLPYVEGTLDPRRSAILEARLKSDPGLAAEVESLRRLAVHIRNSASMERSIAVDDSGFLATPPSVWPRVESAISVRRGSAVYAPRFALAGGLAVVTVAAVYWIGVGHNAPSPAHVQVAVTAPAPSGSANADLGTPISGVGNVTRGASSPTGVAPTPPTAAIAAEVRSAMKSAASGDRSIASVKQTPMGLPYAPSGPSTGPVSTHPMPVEMAASTSEPRLSYTAGHESRPSFTPSVIAGPRSVSIHPPAPPLTAPMVATRDRSDENASDSVHPESVSEADFGGDLPSNPASYQSGLTSPFAMFPSRSIGNKAIIGSTSAEPMRMDVVTHVEDSLKTLRNEAESMTAKSGQLQDALNAWRDAILVDLNATVEQNSTTSVQADETLKMLARTGYLPDFLAMMRNECNASPNELESWRILGHASLVQGDVAGAVGAWMHVTDSSDAVAEDWYQLGLAWEADQNKAGAVGAYAKVLDLNEPSRAADAQARMTALSH